MAAKFPTTKELRALPPAEATAQLAALRQQLWQSRVKTKEGALQQAHLIPATRRQIARLLTVMKQGS